MTAINPLGEVPFQHGGKELTLSFSTMALKRLERAFNLSTPEIGKLLSDSEHFRIEHLVTMFWVGLLDNQPGTSMEEAELILTRQHANQTVALVTKAYELAFPPPEGGAVRPPEMAAKPNGGGTISSSPGKPPA